MTVRRTLERLEALTPARRADADTAALLPDALKVAMHGNPGGAARVRETLEWQEAVAPFSVHLTQKGVQVEMARRLRFLVPIIEDCGGLEAVKVFLFMLGARNE